MKFTDDDAFDSALQLAGIQTSPYVRDLIVAIYDVVKEKKGSTSLQDIGKIEAEICAKHGIDYSTKKPIEYKNKKFFIVKIEDGKMLYAKDFETFTDNVEEANDYKNLEFAEKTIRANEWSGVIVFPYYI